LGYSLYLTHHAERRGPVLRSQPVNSAVPRQCSAKRFTVVLWRVLSRVWTCLWTRARYPSSSFTNSVLSSRHLSRFSDTFHLSRPTTACCAWIDDLLTLVWQMLSPIINVASLGAMIHDAVGISRRECSSEGPRWAYFICGLILCAPPRNHLISCPASRAHARSSCHEILQLKMHLRSLHGRPTTRNRGTRVFHGFHFSFINKKITIAWLNNISKTSVRRNFRKSIIFGQFFIWGDVRWILSVVSLEMKCSCQCTSDPFRAAAHWIRVDYVGHRTTQRIVSLFASLIIPDEIVHSRLY